MRMGKLDCIERERQWVGELIWVVIFMIVLFSAWEIAKR